MLIDGVALLLIKLWSVSTGKFIKYGFDRGINIGSCALFFSPVQAPIFKFKQDRNEYLTSMISLIPISDSVTQFDSTYSDYLQLQSQIFHAIDFLLSFQLPRRKYNDPHQVFFQSVFQISL